MSSDYVVIKLVSGDMFMCYVLGSTADSIIVQDPVAIRQISVTSHDGVIERTVTNPFCSLTDEREYSFDYSHILFIKPLTEKIITYYTQLINELESSDRDVGVFEPDEDEEPNIEPIIVIPEKQSIH